MELVSAEAVKVYERFKAFGDLHEESQELLTEEEQALDCNIYDDMQQEVTLLHEMVKGWMVEADQRIRQDKAETTSTKLIVESRGSKSSCVSITSSRPRALEAKTKHAELESRITQLDQVEAAQKEAEILTTECAAAVAVIKVYEDAIKEDNEQYLLSNDSDVIDEGAHCPSLKKVQRGQKGLKITTIMT